MIQSQNTVHITTEIAASATPSYPVIILSPKNQEWHEGFGRLFDLFDDSHNYCGIYSVLHIEASGNIPHGRIGYYLLTSVQVKIAEEQGLLLVSQKDSTGYLLPKYGPVGSLEEAIQQVQLDILVETATGEKRVK
jgi:hypothetical protein